MSHVSVLCCLRGNNIHSSRSKKHVDLIFWHVPLPLLKETRPFFSVCYYLQTTPFASIYIYSGVSFSIPISLEFEAPRTPSRLSVLIVHPAIGRLVTSSIIFDRVSSALTFRRANLIRVEGKQRDDRSERNKWVACAWARRWFVNIHLPFRRQRVRLEIA